MSNYRVVGTFSVQVDDNNELIIEPQKNQNSSTSVKRMGLNPVNITSSISRYEPIKPYTTYSTYRGLVWGNIKLHAGQMWNLQEEQRVVVEAGSNRIIYYKTKGSGQYPPGLYVQDTQAFVDEVTVREVARQVVEKTRATVVLAEWEVHFLVGFIGASSWIGFAAVMGSDLVAFAVAKRTQNKIYLKALTDIGNADSELKTHAPILRSKILEAIFGYAISDPNDTAVKALEEYIKQSANDSKVTGRAAGAVAAKFIVNPGNGALTAYFILSTILMQVAFKSASKLPPSLAKSLNQKFATLYPNLSDLDLSNPSQTAKTIDGIIDNYKKLRVDVSRAEVMQILTEIKNHPEKIYGSLETIVNALTLLSDTAS